MSGPNVLVIGAGVAGTAAAIAAAQAGAQVTLVDGGPGATVLSNGAIDAVPWNEPGANARALSSNAHASLAALDIYATPDGGVLLASASGILRPARGRDRALLDLRELRGTVLVAGCPVAGWDAELFASAWNDAPEARALGLVFATVDADIARFADERTLAAAAVARRHDGDERLAWLASRLAQAVARCPEKPCAVLCPPWLGVDAPRAEALAATVGMPCGEALALPGGPAGLRFERARDRALGRLGVRIVAGRAERIDAHNGGFSAELDGAEAISADAVVLATGGLIGGGLTFTPSASVHATEIPAGPSRSFVVSPSAPVTIGSGGRVVDVPGSLYGLAPESIAWPFARDPLLERVGVLCAEGGAAAFGPKGLYVAGALCADRPRGWLDALESGAHAGNSAASAI